MRAADSSHDPRAPLGAGISSQASELRREMALVAGQVLIV
jgi:hypothetical protein